MIAAILDLTTYSMETFRTHAKIHSRFINSLLPTLSEENPVSDYTLACGTTASPMTRMLKISSQFSLYSFAPTPIPTPTLSKYHTLSLRTLILRSRTMHLRTPASKDEREASCETAAGITVCVLLVKKEINK
jgi:hypothetical protein